MNENKIYQEGVKEGQAWALQQTEPIGILTNEQISESASAWGYKFSECFEWSMGFSHGRNMIARQQQKKVDNPVTL